jgi:hypothetical protein
VPGRGWQHPDRLISFQYPAIKLGEGPGGGILARVHNSLADRAARISPTLEAAAGRSSSARPCYHPRTSPLVFRARAVRYGRFSADRYAIWSPEGNWIAFDSNRKGHRDLYQKPSSGAGVEELLLDSPQDKAATDWSEDGRFMLYTSIDLQTGSDLWVLPMLGAPVALFHTRIYAGGVDNSQGRQYDVTRDGRFLINTALDDPSAPITLLQNWKSEGKK